MEWTPLDLKNLAALFDDMANQVLEFRKKMGPSLSDAQKRDLTYQFGELYSNAETLEQRAVEGALQGVETDVKDLQSATHDAIAALQTIADVQKAIAIAVAATALGVAIGTSNLGAIGSSLAALVTCVHGPITLGPAAAPGAPAAAPAKTDGPA